MSSHGLPFPALLPPSLPPALSEKPPPILRKPALPGPSTRPNTERSPTTHLPISTSSASPAPELMPHARCWGGRLRLLREHSKVRDTEKGHVQCATSQVTVGRRASEAGTRTGPGGQRQNRLRASQARGVATVLELGQQWGGEGTEPAFLPQPRHCSTVLRSICWGCLSALLSSV